MHRKALRVVTTLPKYMPERHFYEQLSMNTIEDQVDANHAFLRLEGLWQADRFYETWATIFRIARHSNTHHHPGRHRNSPMPNRYPVTGGVSRKNLDVLPQQNMPRYNQTCPLMLHCGISLRILQPRIGLSWRCHNTNRDSAKHICPKYSPREAELHAKHHAITESTRHTMTPEPTSFIATQNNGLHRFPGSRPSMNISPCKDLAARMFGTASCALQDLGFQTIVSSIPGHEGIPGI